MPLSACPINDKKIEDKNGEFIGGNNVEFSGYEIDLLR